MLLRVLILILLGLGLVDSGTAGALIFPQFVSGEVNGVRNSTRIILRNNGTSSETGQIVFLSSSGGAVEVPIGGQSLWALPYSLPPLGTLDKYWNGTSVSTIQNFLAIRQTYNVPLWLGEFGENSNQWGYEVVKMVEENGIGWCWWPEKKLETITSPLSVNSSAGYQAIVDYWNGTGAKPSPDAARTALFQLAEDLAIAKCGLHSDVLRSLLDTTFGQTAKPYGEALTIPGSINAVDFDTGAEGVAYHDAVSKRVTYENWTPWNQGWVYRNDGVDIEESSDPLGFGYNVGWIEDGEWLRYSVDVTSAGTYSVNIRVASSGGGGVLRLSLDGAALGADVSVPGAGGWQAWLPVSIQGVNLPAGPHVLKVEAIKGGSNLNTLEFRKAG